jgi:phage terminase large subunit
METSRPIKEITLPFSPWEHQKQLFQAFEEQGFKRGVLVWARRMGKDVASFNLMLRAALKKPGTYIYMLPTIDQARKVIWNARQNDSTRFIEYIPKELIRKTHEQDMRIEMVNGSVIQLAGSDNYDRLMGMNAWGLVFSEWSLSDPKAWDYLQPIIQVNGGWALFQGTPRGVNHFYDMWNMAKSNPKTWFTQLQTIKDTGRMSEQEIADSVARGEISFEKAQQEFYCSFLSLNEQTYYGRYMDDMRLQGRIGAFPWDSKFPVHTCWDWGHRDQTVCIFFQLIQGTIRIIDCYVKTGEGLEHYAKILKDKAYTYGTHIGPHDMRVHELTVNQTRWAKMHSLGFTFQICPSVPVLDGIEAVRNILPRTSISENVGDCPELIKALENYRAERVSVNGATLSKPVHNSFSDFADALRMGALVIPHIRSDSISPEKLSAMRNTAKYGSPSLSPFFR